MEPNKQTKQLDKSLELDKQDLDTLDNETQNEEPPIIEEPVGDTNPSAEQCHIDCNGIRVQLGSCRFDAQQLLGLCLNGINYLKATKPIKNNFMFG